MYGYSSPKLQRFERSALIGDVLQPLQNPELMTRNYEFESKFAIYEDNSGLLDPSSQRKG